MAARRFWRALLKGVLYSVGALAAAFLVAQLWFFGHIVYWSRYRPETTAFMESRLAAKSNLRLQHAWVPYSRISIHLKRAVVVAEGFAAVLRTPDGRSTALMLGRCCASSTTPKQHQRLRAPGAVLRRTTVVAARLADVALGRGPYPLNFSITWPISVSGRVCAPPISSAR